MTWLPLLALPAPLLALLLRPAHARSRHAILAAVAGCALSVVALLVALLYTYVIHVAAALCGDGSPAAAAAGVAGYLAVASWAALRPDRFWAWPFALLSGVSVWLLVAYFVPAAHGYCET